VQAVLEEAQTVVAMALPEERTAAQPAAENPVMM